MKRTMLPLAKALDELMKRHDMSATDVWTAAGVSPGTLTYYLQGKRGRRMNSQAMKTVEKLASAFPDVEGPEYFYEYRQARVQQMVEEALRDGLIDLEDIQLLLASRRDQSRQGKGISQ